MFGGKPLAPGRRGEPGANDVPGCRSRALGSSHGQETPGGARQRTPLLLTGEGCFPPGPPASARAAGNSRAAGNDPSSDSAEQQRRGDGQFSFAGEQGPGGGQGSTCCWHEVSSAEASTAETVLGW